MDFHSDKQLTFSFEIYQTYLENSLLGSQRVPVTKPAHSPAEAHALGPHKPTEALTDTSESCTGCVAHRMRRVALAGRERLFSNIPSASEWPIIGSTT